MAHEEHRVICIGGATVDRKYHALGPVLLGTSNPVSSERSFGGVARNVAETIARLGVKTSLVSILGDDGNGDAVRAHLAGLGIDTGQLVVTPDHATAEYVAVLGPDGDLVLGLADMTVFDGLTPSLVRRVWHAAPGPWIFAECNLPAPALHDLIALARAHSRMLAVDAVSAVKVTRLPQDLTGLGILFLNLDEARAFLEHSGPGRPDSPPREVAAALIARGAARVVLTLGGGGAIAADAGGSVSVPPVPVQVVDATGAGDALIAATLTAMLGGRSLADAVRMGTVAAALTLECPSSVRPDLSPALLESAAPRSAAQRTEGEVS